MYPSFELAGVFILYQAFLANIYIYEEVPKRTHDNWVGIK